MKISEDTIKDWVINKKRINDRLLRIKKRIKKLLKQEKHFEMRIRYIRDYNKSLKQENKQDERI
jgi:pyruvate-formate lyase-activating enzyme